MIMQFLMLQEYNSSNWNYLYLKQILKRSLKGSSGNWITVIFDLQKSMLCTYHLLPHGLILGTRPGNPGQMVQFWYFLFPHRKWEVILFWKRLCWTTRTYPPDLFKIWSAGCRSRLKLFLHHFISFWCQISTLCCGCSYSPLGKDYLSLILFPLPRGLKWYLFVMKNNSSGVSPRSTHG